MVENVTCNPVATLLSATRSQPETQEQCLKQAGVLQKSARVLQKSARSAAKASQSAGKASKSAEKVSQSAAKVCLFVTEEIPSTVSCQAPDKEA